MIRTMIDSDDLSALGTRSHIVATYADLVTDLTELEQRHHGQIVVLIDRGLGDHTGQASVYDIENHAGSVQHFPVWYDQQHAKGVKFLTAYSDRNTIPAIKAVSGTRNPFHWVATLDGTCHIDGWPALHGPAAIQFAGAAQVGTHVDLSLVLEDNWHPAPGALNVDTARHLVAATSNDIASATSHLHRISALLRGHG